MLMQHAVQVNYNAPHQVSMAFRGFKLLCALYLLVSYCYTSLMDHLSCDEVPVHLLTHSPFYVFMMAVFVLHDVRVSHKIIKVREYRPGGSILT